MCSVVISVDSVATNKSMHGHWGVSKYVWFIVFTQWKEATQITTDHWWLDHSGRMLIPHLTEVYEWMCVDWIQGECWALAEVWVLLRPILVTFDKHFLSSFPWHISFPWLTLSHLQPPYCLSSGRSMVPAIFLLQLFPLPFHWHQMRKLHKPRSQWE